MRDGDNRPPWFNLDVLLAKGPGDPGWETKVEMSRVRDTMAARETKAAATALETRMGLRPDTMPSGGGNSPLWTLWKYRTLIMGACSSLYSWYNSYSSTSAPSPSQNSSPPHNPVHVIGEAITSLSSMTDASPEIASAIVTLSNTISELSASRTNEASALIANAISTLSPNPNVPRHVIASLASVITNLAEPRGLFSDDLPSLGMTYQSQQISLVLTSMLSAAEILKVKVMSPVKVALETKDCITLNGIASELFSTKTLILPMELSSKDGSHWVFLIIDSQFGTVKLLDTENAHEAVVRDFLSHSPLSTWQFSTINIDHQQYSDSCGVEGVSQLIAYLKNTTAIDPASAAVVQSITHLDYLTSVLGSIFNADNFYQLKDFLIEQVNKALNFALDSNNQALVLDLLTQANSVQAMCPIPLGGHPFKPDHDDPDGSFEGGGSNPQNWPVQDKNSIGIVVNINGTIYDKEGEYE